MNGVLKVKIILISCLFCAASAQAATAYRTLETDPSVSLGTLPNGMSYYIVTNPSVKGVADIAVVQKAGTGTAGEEAKTFARECLDSLPLFRNRKPVEFLVSNGVRQTRDGYVKVTEEATVFRFRGFHLTGAQEATDSVLLLALDIADEGIRKYQTEYAPENQAIVISGDVDAPALLTKLRLLSMLIPAEKTEKDTLHTESVQEDTAYIGTEELPHGLSSVKVSFKAGKLPEQYRNTVLPLMSKHLWSLTTKVIRARLEKEMYCARIPVGKITFSTRGDGRYSGKDEYFINVTVASADTAGTRQVLTAVLNDLADGGMSEEEFKSAQRKTVIDMERLEQAVYLSNEIMVNKCISSFLYGMAIVSSKTEADYLFSAEVPDSVWTGILNDFMKGLIENIGDRETVYALQGKPYTADANDTVLFPVPVQQVKIAKSRNSRFSDGPVWQFSNGMTVIYKKLPTDGDMYYSFVIRGGYSEVDSLRNGEGAFYSDMFFTGKFCGVDGRSYRALLADKGISMKATVGLTDMKLEGRVRDGNLELFLKALLAAANGYEAGTETGKYQIDCERLKLLERRGTYDCRMASVDSIMCSGYNYSPIRNFFGLYDDLAERSAEFFSSQFAAANDGALILVGDMEEYKLRKILCRYLGGFRTESYPVICPAIRYQPVSGWSTHTSEGSATTVDLVSSTRLPLTGRNYMSAKIASYFVYDALAGALSDYGLYYYVRTSFSYAPQERFNLTVSVEKADENGLPATLKQSTFLQSLYAVRSSVSGFAEREISEEMLETYKNRLRAEYESQSGSPEYWISVISKRISHSKTFDRFYGDAIDAVTVESVRAVLSALDEGARVEYIVRKQ